MNNNYNMYVKLMFKRNNVYDISRLSCENLYIHTCFRTVMFHFYTNGQSI